MKLLQKDLALYRDLQYEKQSGICLVCKTFIDKDEAVLDHDHKTGLCRGVLHSNCNVWEGKCISSFVRWVSNKKVDYITVLGDLLEYISTDYSSNPLHPTEKTDDEKQLSLITKALKKKKWKSAKYVEANKQLAKELRKKIKLDRINNTWKPE